MILDGWLEPELAQDHAHVALDGLLRQSQPFGDRQIGPTLRHQRKDAALSLGQLVQWTAPARPSQQDRYDFGVDDRPSRADPPDRRHELGQVGHTVLQQVADPFRSISKELQHVSGLDGIGQDQQADVRMVGSDPLGGFQALGGMGRWHPDVDVSNVWKCVVDEAEEPWDVNGIVEAATVEVRGTAHFDGTGAWIKDTVRFQYRPTYSGPGGSFSNKTNQVGTFTPASGSLRAQGTFFHGGHIGTVVYDVGRLVFDMADGSTLFATPKVIPLDPVALAPVDQALCDLIG